MYDYKKVLLKSPTPLVIVVVEDNHAIIRESNVAYKLYITDRYKLFVEDVLTDCIVNFKYRQINIDKTIYNLQIEKIEDNNFIVWFCKNYQPSNEIQERLLLNMGQFDDVILLVSHDQIIFANNAYENLFGECCKIPCNIEDGFYKFIELEDGNESFNYDFHEIVDIRVKIKIKDGCKWVWLRSNPIRNEKDEFVSSYIILTDITNRTIDVINKKATREKFFSFISHEIKNSLNMILATMQLIERKVDQNIYPEDILKHLDLIKRNSFRIMKIVNDDRSIIKEGTGIGLSLVRDFAKLHHGSISVKSEVGVGSEFVVKIANTLADENEIKIHYKMTKEERLQNIAVAFSDL